MPLAIAEWKSNISTKVVRFKRWLIQEKAPYVTYAAVATLSLWPLIEQIAVKGHYWNAVGALFGLNLAKLS